MECARPVLITSTASKARRSKSINALIQRAKRNACGCRNWERFRASILFLPGGLDLLQLLEEC